MLSIAESRQRILLLPLLFLALLFGLCASNAQAAKRASNFQVQDLNGKSVKLSDYRGKVVYLDFWASWCRPCVKSFPWMQKMQSRHGNKGLVILAVNLDDNKTDAWNFLKEHRSNFKILHDPRGSIAEKYQVNAMPSSFLIDRQGRIQKVHYGFKENTRAQKEKEIIALLK